MTAEAQTAKTTAEAAAAEAAKAAKDAEDANSIANQALAGGVASLACCEGYNEKIDRMFRRAPRSTAAHGSSHAGYVGRTYLRSGSSDLTTETRDQSIAAVDQILRSLPFANIAFNVPQSLNLEDVGHVQLVLALGVPVETLEQMITAEGAKSHATIHVATRMEAHLTGANFDITPGQSETQAISGTDPTQWQWDVKPKEGGKQYLHLTLSAVLTIDGSPTPRAIKTFDRLIEVKVHWYKTFGDFVLGHLEWVWTALLVPIALWIWGRWKRRRSRITGSTSAAASPAEPGEASDGF